MLQNSNRYNAWLGKNTHQKSQQQQQQPAGGPSTNIPAAQDFDRDIIVRIQQLQSSNDRAYFDTIKRLSGNKENQIQLEIFKIRNQIEGVKNDLKDLDVKQNFHSYSPTHVVLNDHSKESSVHTVNDKSMSSFKGSQILQRSQQQPPPQFEYYSNRTQDSIAKQEVPCSIYLFCYFARINRSSFVHLLSKNRICLKEPDKVDFERDIFSKAGYLAEKRTLHFKNQILTSAKTLTTEAITCNDRFLLFLGMKSSGKQSLMRHTLEKLLLSVAGNGDSQFRVEYSVVPVIWNCSLIQKLPMPQNHRTLYHSMEAPLEAYNLSLVMSNFWMTMETDAFRETKKLLRMRLQVSQCKGEKKDLLQLMQNHLFCAKLLKLTVMKGGQSKREYWIMTSNFMPSRKGNWVSEVFLETEEHRCLFEGHALNSLQREAAKTIRAVKEEERKVFFCINPLRYRMNECVHTFDVIPNFESQPSSRK